MQRIKYVFHSTIAKILLTLVRITPIAVFFFFLRIAISRYALIEVKLFINNPNALRKGFCFVLSDC